jgi:hypothetical protein
MPIDKNHQLCYLGYAFVALDIPFDSFNWAAGPNLQPIFVRVRGAG